MDSQQLRTSLQSCLDSVKLKKDPNASMLISAYRWILLKSDSDTRMAGINVSIFFVIIQALG